MKDVISQETSARVAWMSFICACMVVFIHAGFTETSSTRIFHLFFSGTGVFAVAVPFFFAASGYFLPVDLVDSYRKVVFRKLQSLFVPYLFWNLIGWVVFNLMIAVAMKFGIELHALPPSGVPFNPLTMFGLDLAHAPCLAPLWYVRGLLLLILVSPLIAWCMLTMKRTTIFLVSLATCYVFVCVLTIPNYPVYDFFYKGIPVEGLFYFSCGMLLRRLKCSFCVRFPWLWLGIGVAMFLMRTIIVCGGASEALRCLAIPLVMLGLFFSMPVRGGGLLRKMSFPIYVLHPLVLLALNGLYSVLGLRRVMFEEIWGWGTTGAVAILVSIGVALAMSRCGLNRVAFGGRC